MKILIIGFWFPPANVIGAIRLGKFARYLDRRGHDVHVLTTDLGEDRSLPLEIANERVVYAEYRERKNWLDTAPWRRRSHKPDGPGEGREPAPIQAAAATGRLPGFLRKQYYGVIHLPDMRTAWIKTAVPSGRRLIREWRPDLIFASAPPNTGLIVASRLARSFGIPWVADLRDLWVDNPYYSAPAWRRPVDAVLEWLTLRDAAGLVTVSPSWANQLRRRHAKATAVVYNGYAEEDFPESPTRTDRGEVLTIRYTGSIYPGFRDPSALFAAIRSLPDGPRNGVTVEFFSDEGETVLAAAAAHCVTDAVAVRPRVPYRRALELQMDSDILLLLQSSDARDEGNLPAKIFEYFYARRPILFIGYEHGIAARFIRERGAGLVSNSPARIRDQLRTWIADKQAGRLKMLDPSVRLGLSRDEQYRKLEEFLTAIHRGRINRGYEPDDA